MMFLFTYKFLQRFRKHGCHVPTFGIRNVDAFRPSNELAMVDSFLTAGHPLLGASTRFEGLVPYVQGYENYDL